MQWHIGSLGEDRRLEYGGEHPAPFLAPVEHLEGVGLGSPLAVAAVADAVLVAEVVV